MNRVQPDTTLPKTPAQLNYKASLTQSSTAAPVATELYNNGGIELTWLRDDVGQYSALITLKDGTEPADLSTCTIVTCQATLQDTTIVVYPEIDQNKITLTTKAGVTYTDGLLSRAGFQLTIITSKL